MPEPTPPPGHRRQVTTFLVSDDEAVVYDPYKGELRKEKSNLVEKSKLTISSAIARLSLIRIS
jgi:hypothetical protein